jgi:hypothetical protein
MIEKNKKMIAKEIIIFFSIGLIVLTIFIGLSVFNYSINRNIEKQELDIKTIQKQIDTLSILANLKVSDESFPFAISMYMYLNDLGYISVNDTMFLRKIENINYVDSLFSFYQIDNKDMSRKQFVEAIDQSKPMSIRVIEATYKQRELKRTIELTSDFLNKYQNKFIDNYKMYSILIMLSFVLVILVYPVRLLFYLLIWAFKTLRKE